jgi:hypothetical protein
MGMDLGAVAVAQNQAATPAQSSADRQIVRQLKDINSKLGFTFRKNSLVGVTDDGFEGLRARARTRDADLAESTAVGAVSYGVPERARGECVMTPPWAVRCWRA